MAEFGLITAQGAHRVGDLVALILGEDEAVLPGLARPALRALAAALAAIPGVGPITASAIVASVGDASQFGSARQFGAWIGLVPKQNSSSGKSRQGGISQQGDRSLHHLLVLGATAVIRHARTKNTPQRAWLRALLAHRPARLVSVALANKTARIAWALLARGESYRSAALAQASG